MEGSNSEIDPEHVHLIWNMIPKLAGVSDKNKVPQLDDPESQDVKIILLLYSLESFLFKRLN